MFRPFSQITSHLQECIQSLINGPRLRAPFTRFPPELHTAPFKLGPPSLKSPFLHSGNLSSLGNPALYAEVPWSLEHAPSPLPGGPYLLPRVPLPSHIPVRRSGGPETVESSVRGLDTPHSSCSGSRAGLGSPPQARPLAPPPPQPPLPPPPRSLQQLPLRAPGQLPVRRRDRQAQGADGNESNGALRRQQRPMERGGGTGDRRQRPLAVTRRHAARREGSGGGAAAPRGSVKWGGAGGHPCSSLRPCLFPKWVPPSPYTAFPLRTEPRVHIHHVPGPPSHTLRDPSPRGPASHLSSQSPSSFKLRLQSDCLREAFLRPQSLNSLTPPSLPGQVLGAETTDVKETLPTLEDVTFSNLSAATEHYLRDLGSTCLHFLIYSSRLNSVNPLLPLTTPLKTLFVSKFKG